MITPPLRCAFEGKKSKRGECLDDLWYGPCTTYKVGGRGGGEGFGGSGGAVIRSPCAKHFASPATSVLASHLPWSFAGRMHQCATGSGSQLQGETLKQRNKKRFYSLSASEDSDSSLGLSFPELPLSLLPWLKSSLLPWL